MQNNPSLPPYDYDVAAELDRQHELARRVARQHGNLYAPYLVPTRKPVLVVKHSHLAVLGVSVTLLLVSAYGLYRLLFPHM